MSPPIFVKLGLATPLGLSARATQCAIAAGLTGFADTDVADSAGEPVRASRLSSLDPATTREERMLFLGQRALAECLAGLDPRRLTSVACYLALPERDARPFNEAYVARGLRDAADPALPLDWSARPILAGRAGVFAALEAAAAAIASGRTSLALVGGVDSHCDHASLQHLAAGGRTLGKSNPDGLIPGEGAGFVLLARAGAASGFGAPLGRLIACATSQDSLPFNKRNPMHAVGLTAMFRQLRHLNAGQPRPQHLYSCQTGESPWARELSNAYLRNAELMPEPFRTSIIAGSLGDAGAASPVVQLGVAFYAFAAAWRAGTPADRAVLYGAADSGSVGGGIVAH
ncbi:beta-ketoacyl synthase N-terminal-like domain-containing protein [Sorangium sp. So ce131]|uniref:beta-ketoacyl synthase N-terminal-like domain-containing protein n=1 Tax=Sorangium sp. So ce131 TaxID=3133282 RepID=UPI003F6247AD